MRNIGIIKNAAMTTSHLRKDKRNMKNTRVTSLSALLVTAGALLFATGAHATVVDLINGNSGTITNS
jgi:pyridoxine 5'-phosphate synthase PdxJ